MCASVLALGAGCSGINASKSVSPLDFLLPGSGGLFHMQYKPPPAWPGTNNTVAALQPLTFLAGTPQ
jgi:hypothetical protein